MNILCSQLYIPVKKYDIVKLKDISIALSVLCIAITRCQKISVELQFYRLGHGEIQIKTAHSNKDLSPIIKICLT